jgi:hypothetical protein
MAKPQKRPPTPVTEQLKAERIQVLLAQRPDLLLSGIQVALGPLTLFLTPADGKTLTKEDLEFAAALQKAA